MERNGFMWGLRCQLTQADSVASSRGSGRGRSELADTAAGAESHFVCRKHRPEIESGKQKSRETEALPAQSLFSCFPDNFFTDHSALSRTCYLLTTPLASRPNSFARPAESNPAAQPLGEPKVSASSDRTPPDAKSRGSHADSGCHTAKAVAAANVRPSSAPRSPAVSRRPPATNTPLRTPRAQRRQSWRDGRRPGPDRPRSG